MAKLSDRSGNVVPLRAAWGMRGIARWTRPDASGIEPPDAALPETLGQAYVRRHAELRAFMLRRTGDPQVADDLVQELWLCIAKDADETGYDNPDAWLQKIAVNLALNWLKSHRFRSRLTSLLPDDYDAADDAPDQEHSAHYRQGLEFLKGVIDELPQRQRLAFMLYRGEGLSLKETAQRMGVKVITVQVQTANALRYLRARMIEAGLWP